MSRNYYEAYDDRYRQVHGQNLQWFYDDPTPIVQEMMEKFGITKDHKLLELGCGEGRDAYPLLKQGYDLLATDISPAAIEYAKKKWPEYSNRFQVLDCISGEIGEQFSFIYAVAVVHMLVEDPHRNTFYAFLHNHLAPDGVALICTMGDGKMQHRTDVATAFDLQERTHEQTGKTVQVANTSCRVVDFETLHRELKYNHLIILEEGTTAAPPDFPVLMYAVVKGENHAV